MLIIKQKNEGNQILTPGLKKNFEDILKEKDLKMFKDTISLEMEIKNF